MHLTGPRGYEVSWLGLGQVGPWAIHTKKALVRQEPGQNRPLGRSSLVEPRFGTRGWHSINGTRGGLLVCLRFWLVLGSLDGS